LVAASGRVEESNGVPHVWRRRAEGFWTSQLGPYVNFLGGTAATVLSGSKLPSLNVYRFTPNTRRERDPRRFLMTKAPERQSARTEFNVVLNWFEDLKKKVPVK
jgi:hypothetical protein